MVDSIFRQKSEAVVRRRKTTVSAFNKEAVIQLQVTRKETKEENTAGK